jgi:hypothetical protein
MTPSEIRAAIAADPALQALVPNVEALAAALSAGRTKLTPTEVGAGTVLEVLGMTTGNALLDVIDTVADFRHVRPLVQQGRLRLDSPLVIGTMQSLVGTVLTQAQADALKARATVPDPVDLESVKRALWADDGTLLV